MYFSKSFFGENNVPVEVEIICDKCGKTINLDDMSTFVSVQSEYCVSRKSITCECGNVATPGIIEYKKNISLKQATIKCNNYQSNTPKCPTCGSTNIKLITATERATSILGLGIFSKKINKSYKCLNCKYTW